MKTKSKSTARRSVKSPRRIGGIAQIRRALVPVLKEHGVKRAAVFGSFARGEATRTSDLDLLIEFYGQKSLFDLVGLKLDLEKRIHRQVDMVTYRALHPALRKQILEEQVTII